MSLCELCISGKHSSAPSASISAVRKEVFLCAGISEQLCAPDLNFLTSNSVSIKVKFCDVYCKLNGCSAIRVMII